MVFAFFGIGVQIYDHIMAMLKKRILGIPASRGKERGSKYQAPALYYKNKKQQQQQPTKYAAPKSVIRRIQQPR